MHLDLETIGFPLAAGAHELPLLTTLAAAFTAAWLFGLITQRLGLSPIVGYLLAGVAIGPYTPGFVGDVSLAPQLAELGVILLMFGVGLHFHLDDLLAVRKVAVPGAIGQSAVATVLGLMMAVAFGWSWQSGLVLGVAMSVASTVVLIRVLTDARKLDTPAGHVAIGWLIVEDLLTILVLVVIPALAAAAGTTGAGGDNEGVTATAQAAVYVEPVWKTLGTALAKLAIFIGLLFVVGSKVIPWTMVQIARLRSRELFTLTVLVMSIAIATGAYYMFGASMALGAFLAGMVVGQSSVSQQVAADALPFRDAFAVLFFASVGMLFDPRFLIEHWDLMLCGTGIVMIGKPLAALLIVAILGYPARTGLVVALALAQIGEFSFIVGGLGKDVGLLDANEYNLIVGTAIVSITLNPMLFRALPTLEKWLRHSPALWRILNRNETNEGKPNARANAIVSAEEAADDVVERNATPLAVILGFGPVGQSVDSILRNRRVETIIVDLNMDTIERLGRENRAAIYGDAFNIEVLSQALNKATHLIITLPHSTNRNPLIAAAKLINPAIKVFVRARYLSEGESLDQVGADAARYEEAEVALALARLVLSDQGADDETIQRETIRVRQQMRATTRRW